MSKYTLLGASALVLALGVATASAEPFNPASGYDGSAYGYVYGRGENQTPMTNEGRAAAVENTVPTTSILEQFHEGK
jgi:hypothetical protein